MVQPDTTWGIAFLAGLLSFVSPCVLPLIPAYISYLTGRASLQVTQEMNTAGVNIATAKEVTTNRIGVLLHGMAFVAGFTFIFIVFGLVAAAGSMLLRQGSASIQDVLAKLGGIVIIFFGLHLLGVTSWVYRKLSASLPPNSTVKRWLDNVFGMLYSDTRADMNPRSGYGYLGSALMGITFAAGWSPCIGPILGSILFIASFSDTASLARAAGLLLAYSLGLGLPFLLAAVALDQMRGLMRRIQKHMRLIEVVSGTFLIIIGIMLLTGTLATLSQGGSFLAQFSYNLEACVVGLVEQEITASEFSTCMDKGPDFKATPAPTVTALSPGQTGDLQTNATFTPAANSVPAPESVQKTGNIGLKLGDTPPDFTVKLLDGGETSLAALRGRVVLLNFWATWCAPCAKEMPDFQALTAKYPKDKLTVLAVNFGESPQQIKPFVAARQLTFDIGLDESGDINQTYAVKGYPFTLVIDAEGTIRIVGQGIFKPEQFTALDKMLAQ